MAEEKNTVKVSTSRPAGHLYCPSCGNSKEFVEQAQDVIVTTRYHQNLDGSFIPEQNDTEILGAVYLLCGKCGADMTPYHGHFLEMIF